MIKRGDMCFVGSKLSPRNLRVTCDRHCKQRCEVNTRETRLDGNEKWCEGKELDGEGRRVAGTQRRAGEGRAGERAAGKIRRALEGIFAIFIIITLITFIIPVVFINWVWPLLVSPTPHPHPLMDNVPFRPISAVYESC